MELSGRGDIQISSRLEMSKEQPRAIEKVCNFGESLGRPDQQLQRGLLMPDAGVFVRFIIIV